MLTTLLLCFVVCASSQHAHGDARSSEQHEGVDSCTPNGDRPEAETHDGRERNLSVLLHSSSQRDIQVLDYCVYYFQVDAELTLTCKTGNKDRMLYWTDAPHGGWHSSAVPSSTELRLKLSVAAGDEQAHLACSDKPRGNHYLRNQQEKHIDITLIPISQNPGVGERLPFQNPKYLSRWESWAMNHCDSGWIKKPKKKHPETHVYKRRDIIFYKFNKKDNGTILYCNKYLCINNPDSQEYHVGMNNVMECTRTQLLHVFLLKEDSRGDITQSSEGGSSIRFPTERDEIIETDGRQIQSSGAGDRATQQVATDGRQIQSSGAGDRATQQVATDGRQIQSSGAGDRATQQVATDGRQIQSSGAGDRATQQVATDGRQIQSSGAGDRKQAPEVGVVVGVVLGVVVVVLLVALGLVLRHAAAARDNTPSEPYVVYTELAKPPGGGMAPPPPPRNLPPYACVVGTLVPAAPKLAPRPISHTYCTVK